MAQNDTLFRPKIRQYLPHSWIVIIIIFLIHAFFRFGGLWNPILIPMSMIIIWPLPWLLSSGKARKAMRFSMPENRWWFLLGPFAALLILTITTLVTWLVFNNGNSNWFTRYALLLGESLSKIPGDTSQLLQFIIVTLPAMLFSPLAEEFLYRGYMLTDFSQRWDIRTGMILQSAAFAFVHLAHYGLYPFQPALVLLWIPSMFMAALVFGWITWQSKSIWCAVVSHSIYNLGMNGIVFLLLPDRLGL